MAPVAPGGTRLLHLVVRVDGMIAAVAEVAEVVPVLVLLVTFVVVVDAAAVAATVFSAVAVYALFLVGCSFQAFLHIRDNRRGAITLS